MARTVLILGGSFAGLHVAHALLKKRDKGLDDVKVVLVSKNTHFYWNIASVRAIVPGQVQDEDIFKPLESALSRYPAESWELVIGAATAADFDTKTVEITLADKTTRSVSYDQLVLATGTRAAAPDMPWKASGSYEEIRDRLHQTAAQVEDAKRIVVAGAGATGVEVAGELGNVYGKTKEIMLLCAGDHVLPGDTVGGAAAKQLKKLKVVIKFNARVVSTRLLPAGKTEVVLSNGEIITADLYLPTTGLVPNTEYIPAKYLSANPSYRAVVVDGCLRVLQTQDVWACGDIVSRPRAGFFITQKHAFWAAKNVEAALAGKPPSVAVMRSNIDVFACAVGRSRGVGRLNSFQIPSFVVWFAKSRTLGVPMIRGYVEGSVT